jgi:PEP-CTERM motif
MPVLSLKPMRLLLYGMAVAAGSAFAQGITRHETVIDNADVFRESEISTISGRVFLLEANYASNWGSATFDGQTASVTHRMAWHHAQWQEGSTSGFGPFLSEADLGYRLKFTIDDPERVGYTLQIEGLLAGYLSARVADSSPYPTSLYASHFVYTGFDAGQGEISLEALRSPFVEVSDSSDNRTRIEAAGTARIGRFVGTRDFEVIVSSPSTTSISDFFPEVNARTDVVFGLETSFDDLRTAFYPADGDVSASDHGHWITVQAKFAVPAVPEPASWLLMALGSGVFAWRSRRRT